MRDNIQLLNCKYDPAQEQVIRYEMYWLTLVYPMHGVYIPHSIRIGIARVKEKENADTRIIARARVV